MFFKARFPAPPHSTRLIARAAVVALALSVTPAMQVQALGTPESYADLAAQISPSVVNITTSSVVAAICSWAAICGRSAMPL